MTCHNFRTYILQLTSRSRRWEILLSGLGRTLDSETQHESWGPRVCRVWGPERSQIFVGEKWATTFLGLLPANAHVAINSRIVGKQEVGNLTQISPSLETLQACLPIGVSLKPHCHPFDVPKPFASGCKQTG